MKRTKALFSWLLSGTAAVILLQTLFFKFSGAAESVYIFSTVGRALGMPFLEPWGRIGSGVVELIASALLLWPRTRVIGGVLAALTMASAVVFHATILGIVLPVGSDGGELFTLAVTTLVCSTAVALMHHDELPMVLRRPVATMAAAK